VKLVRCAGRTPHTSNTTHATAKHAPHATVTFTSQTMTETQTFTARLPDGSTHEIEARWCPKAKWFVGRYNGGSFYFEPDGTQV